MAKPKKVSDRSDTGPTNSRKPRAKTAGADARRISGLRDVQLSLVDGLAAGNPREMTLAMSASLHASIGKFGYVSPAVVREEGSRYEIIDGHHRLWDLTQRGVEVAPVVVVDVTREEGRVLALALNRIGGDWRLDELDKYVESLIADGLATAEEIVRTTGFSADELERLAAGGTEFLDEVVHGASAEASASAAHPTVAGGDGAGAPPQPRPAPDAEEGAAPASPAIDLVRFAVVCTPAEQKVILKAVDLAKKRSPGATMAQAIVAVCSAYVEGN